MEEDNFLIKKKGDNSSDKYHFFNLKKKKQACF